MTPFFGGEIFAEPEGAPAPALGLFDEVGAERVAFDVAADLEKVAVGLDREALEAALVEVTASAGLAVSVPSLRKGHCEPLHETRELAVVGRPEHEVEVVRHQAIVAEADAGFAGDSLGEGALEGGVVGVVVEKVD